MNTKIEKMLTCDNCARLYNGKVRRHYCSHCDKYFYICPACSAKGAHCRFCGVPLKNSVEKRKALVKS
jgi:hypothetical protein